MHRVVLHIRLINESKSGFYFTVLFPENIHYIQKVESRYLGSANQQDLQYLCICSLVWLYPRAVIKDKRNKKVSRKENSLIMKAGTMATKVQTGYNGFQHPSCYRELSIQLQGTRQLFCPQHFQDLQMRQHRRSDAEGYPFKTYNFCHSVEMN